MSFSAAHGGGAAILVNDTLRGFNPRRLENALPEIVTVVFDGALCGCARPVAVVTSYVTPSQKVLKAYQEHLGHPLIEALANYIISLRTDFEVIWTGDFSIYTAAEIGWSGAVRDFTTVPYWPGTRVSEC